MNIGNLTIEIATNVARVQADMLASKQHVTSAMRGIEQAVGAARSAFVALTGVTGVGVFVHLIDDAIEAKAKLYDLSLQTGISVETLGGLTKVARLSGTTMADVAGASNKLSKALATNNEDSKGAAQGVKALGLNFEQFRQLGADEQMLAVAKAMEGFADGTGKSAAAMLLFGKTGATLLPFMKELAERGVMATTQTTESAKAAKEFKDNLELLKGAGEGWANSIANAVLPELVALTQQMQEAKTWSDRLRIAMGNASANAGFNDLSRATLALKDLNSEIAQTQGHITSLDAAKAKGNLNAFGAAELERETENLKGLNAQSAAASEQLKRMANLSLGLPAEGTGRAGPTDTRHLPGKPNVDIKIPEAGKARDDFTPLLRQLQEKVAAEQAQYDSAIKLTEAQKLQVKVFADIDGGYLQLTLQQKLVVDGRLQELLALDKLNAAEQANAKWLEESRKENERTLDVQDQRVEKYSDETLALQRIVDEYGLSAEAIERNAIARLRDASALALQRRGVEDFNPAQAEANRLLEQQAKWLGNQADLRAVIAGKQARDRNDPYAGAGRAVKQYLDEVKAAGVSTERVVGDALRGLEDGMVSLFTKGKFDARSFIDTLIAEFIRLRVVKPMLADIFGGLGGGGSGGGFLGLLGSLLGGGGGGGGAGAGAIGNMGAAFLIPGLAVGGPAQAGAPYLVGERGPELFVPNASGTVLPNGAGGKSVTLSYAPVINIDSRSDRAQVAQQTAAAVQAGNRQLLEMLHARGIV